MKKAEPDHTKRAAADRFTADDRAMMSTSPATLLIALLLVGAGHALPTPPGNISSAAEGTLSVTLRKQAQSETGRMRWVVEETVESWAAAETAICIVDMWDSHHCPSAVERIKPLAVMMNRTVAQARARGISIIHAPSGCSKSYTSHPARRYTVGLPKATLPPAKNHTQPPFPIASVDGGCDVHDGSAPDGPFEVAICNICFISSPSP